MGLTSNIANDAGIDVTLRGGLALVAVTDASTFIATCRSRGIAVLGIDGFDVEGIAVRPDMAVIADFSSVTEAGDSANEANAFLAKVARPGLYLDFTLAE